MLTEKQQEQIQEATGRIAQAIVLMAEIRDELLSNPAHCNEAAVRQELSEAINHCYAVKTAMWNAQQWLSASTP